jgi:predicted adenine nucleotide alpha hydrolase (AANH) superfamily ATPase
MLQNDVVPVIYYCNPNIYPLEEYEIRKNEITRYAQQLGIEIIEDEYDHGQWLEQVRGLEQEPERGGRCLVCFKMRLLRAARKAAELGIDEFTTTLASSRWKSLEQITEAGECAASQVNQSGEAPIQVHFDARNWRKGGLQQRRNELLKQNGFYNQLYCGCEFSREAMQRKGLIP